MADALQITLLAAVGLLTVTVLVLALRQNRGRDDDARTEMAVMARMMEFERTIRAGMDQTQKEVAESRNRLFEAFTAFQQATTESMQGTRKEVGES